MEAKNEIIRKKVVHIIAEEKEIFAKKHGHVL
jgi:hypothetical protein